jgi:hypothetical protein
MRMKSILTTGAVGALTGAAALFALTTGASAYVVCNDSGDCWHSNVKTVYPDEHIVYYDDNWDWKSHHYHWHDVNGDYGYWDSSKNAWVTVHPAQPGEATPDDPH